MKIGLIHNRRAGDALGLEDLTQAIQRHGHEVAAVARDDGPMALDLSRLDVVAAAGGDGTIAAVARAMAGSIVPVGILAMGTANNIALSLGIPASVDEAVASWTSARPRPLDLGVATGPWGERWFVESVGGGLVTHGIVVMDRQDVEMPTTAEQLSVALDAHAGVLGLADVVPWRLVLDGEPIEGEFLLVEVLNIASSARTSRSPRRRRRGTEGSRWWPPPATTDRPWPRTCAVTPMATVTRRACAAGTSARWPSRSAIGCTSTTKWSASRARSGPACGSNRGRCGILVPESPVHLAERSADPEPPVDLPKMGGGLPNPPPGRRRPASNPRQ